LRFKGVSEYLEDLVARIDAPLLVALEIIFFHQLTNDTSQLAQFISRTPKFKTHDKAQVVFYKGSVCVRLPGTFDSGVLNFSISCGKSDWQLLSLTQVFRSSFPQALITMVEHLSIRCIHATVLWEEDIENNQWQELLHPFTAVKDLYICRIFTPQIANALQELVGERVTEVLPALQSLFLEESDPSGDSKLVQENIAQIVSARQLADHPITISRFKE
jgi:hypothetical protein